MDKAKLAEVLEAHCKWIYGEDGGTRANLSGANLSEANLSEANLWGANLSEANLWGANLWGANLSEANLWGANLWGANLSGANLWGANLSRANLSRANLWGANLWGANLSGANLSALDVARLTILPEGMLVGWKKCQGGVIVCLNIPPEARRSNATGRKCRAEFADVVSIDGADVATSIHDPNFTYRVGQRVTCHEWEDDRWTECGGGIHFYLTRVEAEAS